MTDTDVTKRHNSALRIVVLLALAVAGIWLLLPSYIVLAIPVAPQSGGGDFWWERQYAQLALADEWGVLLVHRQVGTAYPATHGWRSVDEAFAYFDTWLRARGWDGAGQGFEDPIMPESRLLDRANQRTYFRSTDPSARAHIAIWPIGGAVEGFHVAVVTSRPSLLMQFGKGFD
jgi:hypothetical protein